MFDRVAPKPQYPNSNDNRLFSSSRIHENSRISTEERKTPAIKKSGNTAKRAPRSPTG